MENYFDPFDFNDHAVHIIPIIPELMFRRILILGVQTIVAVLIWIQPIGLRLPDIPRMPA